MLQGPILIITASLLWALDALIRYPMIGEGVPALEIVFVEHCFLFVFSAYFLFKNISFYKQMSLSDWGSYIIVGCIGSALATYAFTLSFQMINPSLVIILQKFQPVVAIAMTRLVLGERIGVKFCFWAVFCLVGVFLISFSDLSLVASKWGSIHQQSSSKNLLIGYSLVLVSIVGWGATTVFGKRLHMQGHSEVQIMSMRFALGLFILFFFTPKMHFQWSSETVYFGKIFFMVLISGLLAMYLFYSGLAKVSARACTLLELFFPFFAVVVNWIFLEATLQMTQVVGGLMLMLGSTIILIKKY